jgi:HK97 family phage portal protein
VFTVINKITEPASTVPIQQVDRNGEEVPKGKMITLLNKPNPYMSQAELIEAALTFYLIYGDCFISFEKLDQGLNAGLPLRLDVLPPQWVEIKLGTYFDPVIGYKLLFSGNVIDYAKEQVMHWKEFNPDYEDEGVGHLRGMSRLKPILKSITGSGSAYDALVAAFQHQGAMGLLSILGEAGAADAIGKQQLSQIKDQYRREYTGANNAGKIVITNKDHKWTNFAMSTVELAVLESLGTFRGAICDAYNVPAMLLSGSQDRTYSNYQEAARALWTNAIMPSLDACLGKLTTWLGPLFGEEDNILQADYSGIDVLQKNKTELIQWMINARSFTKNEIREAAGYEMLPDPAMDIVYVSAGDVPLDQAGIMPAQPLTEGILKALKIPDYRYEVHN